jgi:predicted O-methyltransferase YrrM
MPDINTAITIEGWMVPAELEWLAQQASEHSRVVEIGSWAGRSTRAMADNLPPGGVIYAVDTWEGSDEDVHRNMLAGKPKDWLFEQFARNIWPRSNVNAVRMSSVDAAKYLKELEFDMIFIDAAHDYESVKADILAWRPLMKIGGMFCGHDFSHPPVKRAVLELVPKAAAVLPTTGDIWGWIVK